MLDERKVEQLLKEASKADLLGKPLPLGVHLPSIYTANKILEVIAGDDYTIKDLLEKVPYSLTTTRSFCRMLHKLGYLERERGKQDNHSCWIYRHKQV
jgi:response regulator of citrate/malate metabolism